MSTRMATSTISWSRSFWCSSSVPWSESLRDLASLTRSLLPKASTTVWSLAQKSQSPGQLSSSQSSLSPWNTSKCQANCLKWYPDRRVSIILRQNRHALLRLSAVLPTLLWASGLVCCTLQPSTRTPMLICEAFSGSLKYLFGLMLAVDWFLLASLLWRFAGLETALRLFQTKWRQMDRCCVWTGLSSYLQLVCRSRSLSFTH